MSLLIGSNEDRSSGKIDNMILIIREQKVILDSDLAIIYGVSTKRLNEQVKRNIERFPEDFMFKLTNEEFKSLKSQFATSKGRGGRRTLPYAFTEYGAVMLASVLNSAIAITASIEVVRAFIRMRTLLNEAKWMSHKLDKLEKKMIEHDENFAIVFEAIRLLMNPSPPSVKRIGFRKSED